MNSCPEFHCTVVTDFLLFIHVTTSARPLLTSKKTHSWSNFSTYKLKVWITFATPPCNQTPYEQERQDAEPLTLKKLFRTCYKEEKKKKDFFFHYNCFFRQWNITWLCVGKLFTGLHSSGLVICFPAKALKEKLLCLEHWTVLEKITETGEIVAFKYPLPFHSYIKGM